MPPAAPVARPARWDEGLGDDAVALPAAPFGGATPTHSEGLPAAGVRAQGAEPPRDRNRFSIIGRYAAAAGQRGLPHRLSL